MENGLRYRVIEPGSGAAPAGDEIFKTHFAFWNATGEGNVIDCDAWGQGPLISTPDRVQLQFIKPLQAVLFAVNEVRPPVIFATLAVILSFLPMLFITGMMGPYMRPMALNVPVAMAMSLLVAFTITPWMAFYILKPLYGRGEGE